MSDTKTQVLEAITASPGSTTAELQEATGLGESTIRKAVKELEASGAVRKDGAAGRSWRFAVTSNGKDDKDAVTDTSKKAGGRRGDRETAQARDARTLEVVKGMKEGGTKADIAAALGEDPSLTYISLWRLHRDGKITKSRNGTRVPIWVAANG